MASAVTAITTCQFIVWEPSQVEKIIERAIDIATAALERVRTRTKVSKWASFITATVAIFTRDYAKLGR